MFERGTRMLAALRWFFAIGSVFFLAVAALFVWRFVTVQTTYTQVANAASFQTPASDSGRKLYLLLPDEVVNAPGAKDTRCTSDESGRWFGSLIGGPSSTKDGTSYTSVLYLDHGWTTNDRTTCTGAAGPAVLAAQGDRVGPLVMIGVCTFAALAGAAFAAIGFSLSKRQRRQPMQPAWGGR
jgi:hypothetical protein